MIKQINNSFSTYFEGTPLLFKATGRVNIIGEHTDYNFGFSLPISIDKAIYFAIRPNDSEQFNIHAFDTDQGNSFHLAEAKNGGKGWVAYFKAIVNILHATGRPIHGVDVVFGGDLPIGAGLSSSAALCCGFTNALNTIYDLSLSKKEMALVAQKAEHSIGLMCGLLDQFSVLFGKKDHALLVDFKTLEVKPFPFEMKDTEFVLIDSKLEHNLAETAYNDRREACLEVVEVFQKKYPTINSLRDISLEMLEEHQADISTINYKRASFVLNENARVFKVLKCFENNDTIELGKQMYESQAGQKSMYEISTPEIDQLIEFAKKEKDILGARMTGGGFGGCIICLIKNGAHQAIENVVAQYAEATGIKADVYPIKIDTGISQIIL